MSTLITGGRGFLGWHLRSHLHAHHGVQAALHDRHGTRSLKAFLESARDDTVVYHLAGVNRAESDHDVEAGNIDLATQLADAILASGQPVHVVYANSIHAEADTAYGRGKAAAAQILTQACEAVGGSLADLLLPNLFGEHGRPHYNSFVATFCARLVDGKTPTLLEDREVPLLHAQRAAEVLCQAGDHREFGRSRPEAYRMRVSDVLERLTHIHDLYAERGELPDLSDPFERDLFNTYRAHLFPRSSPRFPEQFKDPRGRLFETVRMNGGTGQAYVSTTSPGMTRGEHYHLRKFERFAVVSGHAVIRLRRLFHDEVLNFRLDGESAGVVDMPTMWVHNITNVGDDDLITVFWSDQLLDRDNPDQFSESVEASA